MTEATDWAAIGISLGALGWSAYTFFYARNSAQSAERERQIVGVVAGWATTRLGAVTFGTDPDLPALKEAVRTWRENCKGPLTILPSSSRAYRLIEETISICGTFETTTDKYLKSDGHGTYALRDDRVFDQWEVSQALDQLQVDMRARIESLKSLVGRSGEAGRSPSRPPNDESDVLKSHPRS
ncbi:MAG: hypothetical protein ABI647_18490 [Gemmatimonadota bacterium]